MATTNIPRDEFANDPDEVHAISFGFHDGFRRIEPDPKREPESTKESHYYDAAYVAGYVLKIIVLVVLWKIEAGRNSEG